MRTLAKLPKCDATGLLIVSIVSQLCYYLLKPAVMPLWALSIILVGSCAVAAGRAYGRSVLPVLMVGVSGFLLRFAVELGRAPGNVRLSVVGLWFACYLGAILLYVVREPIANRQFPLIGLAFPILGIPL